MVCDEYAAKDPRVRVKHGRNGGICASRNAGLALAKGEWIAFSDHDDHYEPIFLEKLLSAVQGTGHVLVKANRSTFRRDEDGALFQTYSGYPQPNCEWELEDCRRTAEGYRFYCNGLNAGIWDCLIQREFLELHSLRFNENFTCGCEDFDFMLRVFEHVRRGVWVSDLVYRHYLNIGVSTSMRCHLRLLDDYLETALYERRVLGFQTDESLYASFAQWAYLAIRYVLTMPGCELSMQDKAAWVRRYYRELVGRDVGIRAAAAFGWKKAVLYVCLKGGALCFYLRGKHLVEKIRRYRGRRRLTRNA